MNPGLGDLQRRRQVHVEEFEAILNQALNTHCAGQSYGLARCLAIGAFARAAYPHFGPFPLHISSEKSLQRSKILSQRMVKHLNHIWMTAQNLEQLFPASAGLELENPAGVFSRNIVSLWAGIEGLALRDYRQLPGKPLLDLVTLMLGSST